MCVYPSSTFLLHGEPCVNPHLYPAITYKHVAMPQASYKSVEELDIYSVRIHCIDLHLCVVLILQEVFLCV